MIVDLEPTCTVCLILLADLASLVRCLPVCSLRRLLFFPLFLVNSVVVVVVHYGDHNQNICFVIFGCLNVVTELVMGHSFCTTDLVRGYIIADNKCFKMLH